jgi:cytochrome c5
MKRVFIVSLVVFLSACSAKLLVPTQTDADRGTEKYPNVTLAQLTDGKKIYEEQCANCHGYKNITKGSDDDWANVVPKMVKKANKKAGQEVITTEGQELLLKYVMVMRGAKK